MNFLWRRALVVACTAWCIGVVSAASSEYPEWEGYPPMYAMNGVIGFKGKIYGSTKGGILRYDPETREYALYYKNKGLPANNVLCSAATSSYLYFGFETAGLIRYDPESDRFDQIKFPEYVPNKIAVRSLFAYNDSILYVGHSYGIDILNMNTREIRSVTKLGGLEQNTPVNDVKVLKGRIWACTSNGIAVADASNPNLEIETNWKSYTYMYLYLSAWRQDGFNCVMHVDDGIEDIIYLGTNYRGIVSFDEKNGTFSETAAPEGKVNAMYPGKPMSWAGGAGGLMQKYVRFWSMKSDRYRNITGVWSDSTKVWVATLNDGLQCFDGRDWIDVAPVPGPRSMKFVKIALDTNNTVWFTSAYTKGRRTSEYGRFQRLQDGVWTYYSADDGFNFTPVSATVDKNRNVWLPMYGDNKSGVYIIRDNGTAVKDDDEIVVVDPGKKYFKPTIKSYYLVCTDAVTDSKGNVWVMNFQMDEPDAEEGGLSHSLEPIPTSGLLVLDGYPITKSRVFSPASGDLATAKVYDLCIDTDGWVWLGTERKGLEALYVGDNPFDTSKATVKHTIGVAEGLNSTRVKAIRVDRDGVVWVGTDAGLNLVKKYSGYTLRTESVTDLLNGASTEVIAIEVDRLNNKWIGTANGLVKINSSNKLEKVYTTKNSGLFSDTILGLAYDNATDRLWVGTDAGLNTFKVIGADTTTVDTRIHIYPNPFSIWGTDSRCTFDNLKLGSKLRIYTFNGAMVNELEVKDTSQKGISYVTWNGRNYKNEFAASGVYFITGVGSDDRVFRDKMVIMRR